MPLDWKNMIIFYVFKTYVYIYCIFAAWTWIWMCSTTSCSPVPAWHALESQCPFLRVGSMSPVGSTCSPRKPSMSSVLRTCGFPGSAEPRGPTSSTLEECARFVLYFILFEDIFYKTWAIFAWFETFLLFVDENFLVKWTFLILFTCFGYFLSKQICCLKVRIMQFWL